MKLILPIYWEKEYKTKPNKTILAGMNWYRNAHYFDQNKFKQDFSQLVYDQVDNLIPIEGCFTLNIDIYYKNPSCDGSNISALIEKVTLDALQSLNIIENDNVKFHISTTWNVAGKDKDNPRCEIEINNCKESSYV